MNLIEEKFVKLKEERKKALIAYFTAGFPSANETVEIIKKAERCGVDIIEIGIPFSDPIADGPIIQSASFQALQRGMNTDGVFEICKTLNKSLSIPYLLMTYYNSVYRYGLVKFASNCRKSGVAGIVIPDLPYEEGAEAREIFGKEGITFINFITPFTPEERIKKILKDSKGFIYFITSAGVTGPRAHFSNDVSKRLRKTRKLSSVPIAAGFGISSVEQVNKIKEDVDGIIIGSFFAKKIIDGKIEALWEAIKRIKKVLAAERRTF